MVVFCTLAGGICFASVTQQPPPPVPPHSVALSRALPTPFIHQSVTLQHARGAVARFLASPNIHADNWVKGFVLRLNPYTSRIVNDISASEIELKLVILLNKLAALLKCTGCVRERSAWRATKRWELRHPPRTPPWRTTSSSGGATSLEMDTRNLAVSCHNYDVSDSSTSHCNTYIVVANSVQVCVVSLNTLMCTC